LGFRRIINKRIINKRSLLFFRIRI